MEENTRLFTDDELLSQSEGKSRHGCVTAWLVIMILANAVTALVYLFGKSIMEEALPAMEYSSGSMTLLAILGIANVVFAIMLWQWKKLGFYGFVATSIITFGINLSIGLSIVQCLAGLIGLGILYAIFQIEKDQVSAWENLE